MNLLGQLGLAVVVAVVSIALTGLLRRYALARGVIDIPNARSSHTRPTPRGGGVAIVLGMVPALFALWAADMVPAPCSHSGRRTWCRLDTPWPCSARAGWWRW